MSESSDSSSDSSSGSSEPVWRLQLFDDYERWIIPPFLNIIKPKESYIVQSKESDTCLYYKSSHKKIEIELEGSDDQKYIYKLTIDGKEIFIKEPEHW